MQTCCGIRVTLHKLCQLQHLDALSWQTCSVLKQLLCVHVSKGITCTITCQQSETVQDYG